MNGLVKGAIVEAAKQAPAMVVLAIITWLFLDSMGDCQQAIIQAVKCALEHEASLGGP